MRRNKNTQRSRRRVAPPRVHELEPEESGIGAELIRRLHRRNVERPVLRELLKDLESAKGIAVAFAGRNLRELRTQDMDALRDHIFIVLENSEPDSKTRVIRALSALGWMISDLIDGLWCAKIATVTENLELLKQHSANRKRIA